MTVQAALAKQHPEGRCASAWSLFADAELDDSVLAVLGLDNLERVGAVGDERIELPAGQQLTLGVECADAPDVERVGASAIADTSVIPWRPRSPATGRGPRSSASSTNSSIPKRSANAAGSTIPASATARSSSKHTATRSGATNVVPSFTVWVTS
jgi:hypothetical protein